MERIFEKSYSGLVKKIFKLTNPIKKHIVTTECLVHKFINNQAIVILKNDEYTDAYNFLSRYIRDMNAGVVWADQDYKSINHFFNPDSNKGLYGFSNAHRECVHYYTKALTKYFEGDVRSAMFYLGAACHLIQDTTVPQHVNVKLLKNHRKYEQWVIRTYQLYDEFKVYRNGIYLTSIKDYMTHNSRIAIETYDKYIDEQYLNVKFYKTTATILVIAQKTTAGLMLNFYNDIEKIKLKALESRTKKLEMSHI